MAYDPSTIADAKKFTLANDGTDVDANLTDKDIVVVPPATWGGYAALAPVGQGEHPYCPTPIAHYTMDNISGSTLVDEKGSYDGTITNMTPTVGGRFDNYLAGGSNSGGNKNVTFSDTVPFTSFSIWIRRVATTTQNYGLRGVGSAMWLDYAANHLYFWVDAWRDTGIVVNDTNWHHFVFVSTGGTVYYDIYYDNVLYANKQCGLGGEIAGLGDNSDTSYMTADFTNLQIYNTALTDAQVTALYNADLRLYKKISLQDGTTQLPIEVSPNEWEDWVEPTNHYLCDDTGSTLTDEMGDTDGTITGMTPTATGGKFGAYLAGGDITSTTRNVDLGGDVSFQTFAGWFKRNVSSTGSVEYVFDLSADRSLFIKSADSYLGIWDGSGAQTTDFLINDTNWHHVVVVEGASNNSHWVWVDGVKNSSAITSNFGGVLRYFGRDGTLSGYTANLDNIQIYNTALTDAQIAKLYAAQSQYYHPGRQCALYSKTDMTSASGASLVLSYDETQDDNTTYVGLTGETPQTLYGTLTYNSMSSAGAYSRRLFFSASEISANTSPSGQIQIQFMHDGTNDYTLDAMYIWERDTGAGTDDGLAGTEVAITKDGSGSITVTEDGMLSDPIDFDVDGATQLLITLHHGVESVPKNASLPTNCLHYTKAGVTEAATATVSGYASGGTFSVVKAIVSYVPNTAAWDSNYVAVYHMAQDPDSDTADSILDSTANANHGTPSGSMTSADLVDGEFGKAIDFDGSNDYIQIAHSTSLNISADITLEAVCCPTAITNEGILHKGTLSSDQGVYQLSVASAGAGWIFRLNNNAKQVSKASPSADAWAYLAGTYNGANQILYFDGTEADNDAETGAISTDTNPLRIGAYYAAGYTFPGKISEVRISNVARSAAWIKVTNLNLTDAFWTWSAYTSGGDTILQYWDQLYGDPPNTEHVIYWDQSYALLNYIIGYFDSVYGIQLQRYWDHSYGNSPLVKVFWDLLYGNQTLITKFWDLDYGDRVALIRYWDQKYNIRKAIEQHWDQKYSIMGKEILTHWDQSYDVKNTNPLMKFFDQYYHIVADSVVESAALGFYIDGVRYEGPYHVSWELNVDSYKNTGEMHFNYPAPFFAAGEGKEMRIVDTDIDLKLEITIPTKSERTNETLYFIKGESKSRILERAEVFTETFRNTTAATICTTIAARHGITIDWQIPDWPLSEYDVNDQTPLQAIRGLTGDDCAKACLQTDFDGDTVRVVKRMESDSHMWDTDTPSYYITDSLHLEQTNQRGEYKKGYNAYRVTDQSSASETRTWIEDEEYADAKREVHVFRVPWDGTARPLYTSDNNATIIDETPKSGAVILGFTEDLTEEFSIVNGEGEGKTKNPAYAVVDWTYNDTNLGTPTVTEEGVVQTATEGTSMLTLTYTTKYYKWIVTDYDDPKIQIWVE